ncbi:MAG: hypothetical protein ACT4P7_10425, partial [Gemmatimonadaceae bacterium]
SRHVDAGGTLVLFADEGLFEQASGDHLIVTWAALTDATWERETLTLHCADDALALRGPRELSRAWGLVVEHACALPEVARGLRSLGTSRGGSAVLQSRFFGPLLAARRRLQDPEAMERRVTQFDAMALTQRLNAAIAEFASDHHPADPPRRRALEAHLEEAIEPLVRQLALLADATQALHAAPDGSRFVAWRVWTRLLRRVFLEADRAWTQIVRQLERPTPSA